MVVKTITEVVLGFVCLLFFKENNFIKIIIYGIYIVYMVYIYGLYIYGVYISHSI